MRVVSALYRRFDSLIHELAKFGTVGGVAYVVQFATTNAFWWIFGLQPLTGQALGVLCATVVAFLGNRFWTYRHRARSGLLREYVLFFFFNGVGLAIQVGCQAFSLHVLGLDGPLAQNISGNVIGVGLGTLFRFWSYRKWVFRTPDEDTPDSDARAAETSAPGPAGDGSDRANSADDSHDASRASETGTAVPHETTVDTPPPHFTRPGHSDKSR
ncbi:GtrA family protein [Spiractinospora alimapuensis]|nr:GtrA family protein [Spiractinospora alimapuensis]